MFQSEIRLFCLVQVQERTRWSVSKVEEISGDVVMVDFERLQGTNLWSLTARLSVLTVFDKRQRRIL